MDKAASIQYFFTVHDSEARKEGECIFNRIAETSSSNDDDDDEKTCLFYSNRQQREFPVRSRMPRAHYFERLRKIHTFDLLAFHDATIISDKAKTVGATTTFHHWWGLGAGTKEYPKMKTFNKEIIIVHVDPKHKRRENDRCDENRLREMRIRSIPPVVRGTGTK
eukprot:CAMPEP_0172360640 /NCGR_PEP_ID=MMETSP1060-20121228/4627_1 /TAXON_ID=37318 /ORGANISM="Pseudo-nitzschia pungens, Strain cf. cingulata" /LENGTH=164 /DNA_ID=CAMNT_0013082681 /DNA_START=549 /DNA_END=1044 /DNA_ORIENTATION=-